MRGDRVLITGVGTISPLGLDVSTHFERLLSGTSAARVSPRPEVSELSTPLEAGVEGFDRRTFIPDRMLRKLLSPSAAYAVTAAGAAIEDAGLGEQYDVLQTSGLYVGSIAVDVDPEVFIPPFRESLNQQGDFEIGLFATRGMKMLDPLFLVKSLPNAGLCGISILHRVYGPNISLTNGPTSSLQAIALAAEAIRRGDAQVAVAGGYDSLLRMDSITENMLAGRLTQQRDDPTGACRPFDEERDGYFVGEGAAFVILEAESHARSRSARVYAEVAATAHTSQVAHAGNVALLKRRESGGDVALEHAARSVLQQANIEPGQLGVIFGDGLATEADDIGEAAVVRNLVGSAPVEFTAATPLIGFVGAASGAFSLVHAALGLYNQVVPPLINCDRPDPRCEIHFTPQAHARAYEWALVCNSDFGLKNSAALLGSYAG
ncbi:MAG: hypothetical protein M3441_01620 [Chloroflexota bacterium]|nr:hypothetical protein [Chloroflexota bacterium]